MRIPGKLFIHPVLLDIKEEVVTPGLNVSISNVEDVGPDVFHAFVQPGHSVQCAVSSVQCVNCSVQCVLRTDRHHWEAKDHPDDPIEGLPLHRLVTVVDLAHASLLHPSLYSLRKVEGAPHQTVVRVQCCPLSSHSHLQVQVQIQVQGTGCFSVKYLKIHHYW